MKCKSSSRIILLLHRQVRRKLRRGRKKFGYVGRNSDTQEESRMYRKKVVGNIGKKSETSGSSRRGLPSLGGKSSLFRRRKVLKTRTSVVIEAKSKIQRTTTTIDSQNVR